MTETLKLPRKTHETDGRVKAVTPGFASEQDLFRQRILAELLQRKTSPRGSFSPADEKAEGKLPNSSPKINVPSSAGVQKISANFPNAEKVSGKNFRDVELAEKPK